MNLHQNIMCNNRHNLHIILFTRFIIRTFSKVSTLHTFLTYISARILHMCRIFLTNIRHRQYLRISHPCSPSLEVILEDVCIYWQVFFNDFQYFDTFACLILHTPVYYQRLYRRLHTAHQSTASSHLFKMLIVSHKLHKLLYKIWLIIRHF